MMITLYTSFYAVGMTSENNLVIILIPSITFGTIILITIISVIVLCAIKRMCLVQKTSEDPNQQPIATIITQRHKEIPMEENAAYAHVQLRGQDHALHCPH